MSNEEQRQPEQAGNKQGLCLRILSTKPVYETTRTTRQQPVIYHCECPKRILASSSPPLEGTTQQVQSGSSPYVEQQRQSYAAYGQSERQKSAKARTAPPQPKHRDELQPAQQDPRRRAAASILVSMRPIRKTTKVCKSSNSASSEETTRGNF